jgi:hypothetical protein
MPFKPRGMQRLSQFGRQSRGVSDVPTTGSQTDDFLAKAARLRHGGREKEDEPMSKGEERRMKLMQFRNAGKGVAKSAAHLGVTARPMDQRVSKLLEQRRAQQSGRATSASRLRRRPGDPEDEDDEELIEGVQTPQGSDTTEQGTSMARIGPDAQLHLQPLPPGILHPQPPKKEEPPDLPI